MRRDGGAEEHGPLAGSVTREASDDELLRRAREGSASAHGELFDRFRPRVERFIQRHRGKHVGRCVSVSDLCQESYLGTRRGLEALPEEATLDDFQRMLFRNARWVIQTHARKHREFEGESASETPVSQAVRGRGSSETRGEVTKADERAWLERCIEALDPRFAAVVRLRMEGLRFGAIGDALGIGEDAVRKRFLRASVELERRAKKERRG